MNIYVIKGLSHKWDVSWHASFDSSFYMGVPLGQNKVFVKGSPGKFQKKQSAHILGNFSSVWSLSKFGVNLAHMGEWKSLLYLPQICSCILLSQVLFKGKVRTICFWIFKPHSENCLCVKIQGRYSSEFDYLKCRIKFIIRRMESQ